MVAPVVGPFAIAQKLGYTKKVTGVGNLITSDIRRTGSRQKRPYNLPLQATLIGYIADKSPVNDTRTGNSVAVSDFSNQVWTVSSNQVIDSVANAKNLAYARLVGSMGVSAGMGITIAQRKQALGMMGDRLQSLLNFTRHLKRFQFSRAADDLGLSRKRLRGMTLRKEATSLSNNWLEFHFGWSPMVDDIGNAVDVLESPIPDVHFLASGKDRKSSYTITYPYGTTVVTERSCDIKVRMGCDAYVSNPNLRLASQLGFVNPASIAWDAVPFSFVVDWFVNVSQFLGSFTDMLGLTVTRPYTTVFVRSHYGNTDRRPKVGSTPAFTLYEGGTYVSMARATTISGPTLKVKKPWQLSATRGATIAALLVQQMR